MSKSKWPIFFVSSVSLLGNLLLLFTFFFIFVSSNLLVRDVTATINPGNLRVQIFYYTWYLNNNERWTRECHRDLRPICQSPDRIASNFYPQLGPYNSDDVSTIRQHMSWISQAGVNVIILSWWGEGSWEEQHASLLLDIAEEYNIKVAFHIEPYGWGPKRDTALQVTKDIRYIYDKYGNHPAFLRTSRPTKYGPNQKPRGVFYIFDPYKFNVSDSDWKSALDKIRGTSDDAIVIAQTTDPNRIDQAHFDGIYTYDILQLDGTTFQTLNSEVTKRNSIFAPSVGPGYIDGRVAWGSPSRYKDRRRGQTYDAMWQRAIDSKAEWITVTSFNEWHEGTQIEPATPKSTPDFTYLSYEGDYGLTGHDAELAYIIRTAYWVMQLQKSPAVPEPKPQDRTLVRIKNGVDVFWYQNGKRYHVSNPEILNKMAGMPGWGWNLVYEFNQNEIEKIPIGPEFIAPDNSSNGILIRQKGTNEVYRIENGQRAHVSFEECNKTNCWNNVIEVTQEIMSLFTQAPTPSENFLVCAAGVDGLIDDLEVVAILDAWQKQRDYQGCGVPTDDDYMKALNLWQKRQPVDGSPPPKNPDTQKPFARFVMTAVTGQSAKENEQLTLTVPKGQTVHILFSADNSYDPDGGSIRSYEWKISGTFVANTGRFAFDLGAGKHDIFLMVTDDEGQTGAVGATIVITEQASVDNPPVVTIVTPKDGATISGLVNVTLQARDDFGITKWTVEIERGGCFGEENTPYSTFIERTCEGWNSNLYSSGPIVRITASATDTKGQTTTVSITVTIGQGQQPPSQGQAPQITFINPDPEKKESLIIPVGSSAYVELGFYDPDGDIKLIRFEHISGIIDEYDPGVYGQKNGTIKRQIVCSGRHVTSFGFVTLIDKAGNSSKPKGFLWICSEEETPPPVGNRLPTVTLTYWPQNPTPDDTVNFEARASDPDGDPLTYEWFLNGVYQPQVATAGIHWSNPPEGTHTMTVKVSDKKGGMAQASVTFTVQRKRSQAPQITSVEIPNRIPINTPTEGRINFYDPEGNVNWIEIEYFTNGRWGNIGRGNPEVFGYTQGTIHFTITCDSLGYRTHRIILRDAQGNESVPYEYSFECVSGRPPPPPPTPVDSDNDGIPDNQDQCPYEWGPTPTGCPSRSKLELGLLEFFYVIESMSEKIAGRQVYFYFELASRSCGGRDSRPILVTIDFDDGNLYMNDEFDVCRRPTVRSDRVSHIYSNAGSYTVTIRVCDAAGLCDVISRTISIAATFSLQSKLEMISVDIFNAYGKLIFQVAEIPPHRSWQWDMRNSSGMRVPNGVYLAVITVRDLSDYPIRREVRKIVVLR